ncbi:MAG: MotA/TolQ/ExbB proton channel family protein [Candidatus Protistobacter heckmanni]|nr:MotA/TolQ/ExbB proton channel family protein [Candidatus Protistobacter heckmanni]
MESSFGVLNLLAGGDFVIRAVAVFLALMSLASWVVILGKAWDVARMRRQAATAAGFWSAPSFESGLAALADDADNAFRDLAVSAQDAAAHHQSKQALLQNSLNISDWITRVLKDSVEDAQSRMQSNLAILASVGATAPFVGLLGTVWGIYHALLGISAAGAATIDKVAGPVGEALVMTALGLAVAIPAVLGYNALTRANKALSAKLNRFAHDLHAYFVTGGTLKSRGN